MSYKRHGIMGKVIIFDFIYFLILITYYDIDSSEIHSFHHKMQIRIENQYIKKWIA